VVKTEGARIRTRRRKKLQNDPKEKRRYWDLKGEALDGTVCRIVLGEFMDLS
jgi:hypothetical protein